MRGTALRVDKRDEILRGIARGLSGRKIAVGLGRDPAVVSREIARNGGRVGYRVHATQERFESLRVRPKAYKLEADRQLHDEVNAGLAKAWSPRQISARLVLDHLDSEAMRVSHETIYQTLYMQARGFRWGSFGEVSLVVWVAPAGALLIVVGFCDGGPCGGFIDDGFAFGVGGDEGL